MERSLLVLHMACLLGSAMISTSNAHLFDNIRVMNLDLGLPTEEAQNCGDVPFKLSWTPDVLTPSEAVKVHVDYTLPHDFDGGFVNATVYIHGDKEPFVGYASDFDCDKISKFFPCPSKKGYHYVLSQTFPKIHNIGTYPGDYDVHVIVNNKQNKLMFCMKAHVIVKGN